MTYLVKGKIKGSGGRGKEKLEIRNVNVRSITLTENGCTSPEDRVLSDRRGDGCSRSATPRGEMSFVVAAGAAVFVMLTQDEGALTLQWARARTVRFARKSGKAELRLLLVVTILGLDLCTVDACAL